MSSRANQFVFAISENGCRGCRHTPSAAAVFGSRFTIPFCPEMAVQTLSAIAAAAIIISP